MRLLNLFLPNECLASFFKESVTDIDKRTFIYNV